MARVKESSCDCESSFLGMSIVVVYCDLPLDVVVVVGPKGVWLELLPP